MEFTVKIKFTCNFADSRIQEVIRETVEREINKNSHIHGIEHTVELVGRNER